MSIRKFIPKLVLVTATAGGLFLVSAGSAGASSAVDDAKVVLDELCEARGGDAYSTPYSITRCQFARANKGFETEQAVCEGLADGEFIIAAPASAKARACRPW